MNIDNIIPLDSRVLIEVIPDETQLYGGMIATVDSGKEKSNIGRIKSVSQGSKLEIGQTVIFSKYSGAILKTDHFDKKATEFRLINESDILALIQD